MATTTQVKNRQAAQNRLIAYSHPLRAAVFTILTERTASPSQIAKELGLDRGAISSIDHHIKRLVELGCAELVERDVAGNFPQMMYKATERALIETDEWLELLEENPALAEHHLGQFMQVQLDDYVLAIDAGTLGQDERFYITRTRRVLDPTGFVEAMEIRSRADIELAEVERRSAERRREDGADAIHVSDSNSLFPVPAPKRWS
jgi:DNA-binding transcriptional ArsR family regulator